MLMLLLMLMLLGSTDWTRTSNPPVNSRMLCQLSYGGWRVTAMFESERPRECRGPDLNWGHPDFQSSALPTELPRPKATAGIEPAMRVLQTLALPLGDVAGSGEGGI